MNNIMKVAVATENGHVAQHFGRCSHYTIANVDKDNILSIEIMSNPGHEPGYLPQYLSEKGVECIIAGGMGTMAQNLFAEKNICTIVGIVGDVNGVLQRFAEGKLKGAQSLCHHE